MQVGVRDSSGRYTKTFDILVKLPTGTLTPLNVRHDMTIGELKSVIEISSGIPSDLMLLCFGKRGILTDGITLGELCFIPGTRLPVKIIYGYEKLVNSALSGDTKGVLADVEDHHDTSTVTKRQTLVLFMAAHRGFYYLVDKILSAGAIADSQTPSGRTALHAACAMGNLGCIDSLLQHNAALDIRDCHGRTPAQVAFSCGQQNAERRILLYQRVRNQQKREKQTLNQSWPRSSRFPVSKLAQSISPTLALQDLMISPGPTLKITPWKCKNAKPPWALSQAVPAVPGSSSSSNSSNSGSDVNEQSDEEYAKSEASTEEDQHASNERSQLQPSPRETPHHIRFSPQVTTLPMNKYRVPQATSISTDFTVNGMMSAYKQRQSGKGKPTIGILKKPIRPTSAMAALLPTTRREQTHQITSETMPPKFELTPSKLTTVTTAENDDKYTAADEIQLPPKVRDEVDRMRRLVDLPVEYPEEDFGVAKIFGNKRQRAGSARRRATPEENQRAYKEWLASKSQDARDKRLVNKVGNMLDEAFGRRTPEQLTMPVTPQESNEESKGTSFDKWVGKKNVEKRILKSKQEQDQTKIQKLQQQKLEDNMAARVKAVDQWVNQKLEIEKQKHIRERQQAKQRGDVKTERAIKAEAAFQNWSMRKEWEELEKIEKRPHTTLGQRTPQVRNHNTNRRRSTGQAPSRIRSVSQPTPRRTPSVF